MGDGFKVIGTCCLGPFDPTHLQIYNFKVKNEHLGKGVEARLFSLARRYAKHLGFVTFVKSDDQEGQRTFTQLGGKVGPVNNTPPGHTAVVFKESRRVDW
jgi:hypothetical protein